MPYLIYVYRIILLSLVACLTVQVCVDYFVFILLFLIFHISYRLFIEKKYQHILDVDHRSVLISGCDTGFGYHLANRLADKGFVVFAGVLNLDSNGADELRNKRLRNLHVIQLDVSKDEDVQHAFKTVIKTSGGLWAVVNNAGINFRGDLELVLMDYYKRCHDVNLYGPIRIIKKFLPYIRKSKGRIINVSSARGRYSLPGDTVYQSSKFGLETLSDSLRLEMVKFGVGVSVVEPARYDAATSCSSPEMCERLKKLCEEMWKNASPEVKNTYGSDYFYLPYERMKSAGTAGTSLVPDPVLDAIEDALLNVCPKPRYLVDSATGLIDRSATMSRIFPLIPEYISDFVLNYFTGCYHFPTKR